MCIFVGRIAKNFLIFVSENLTFGKGNAKNGLVRLHQTVGVGRLDWIRQVVRMDQVPEPIALLCCSPQL